MRRPLARAGPTGRAPRWTAGPSTVSPPLCAIPRPHIRHPSSRACASPIKGRHPLTSRARAPLSPPCPPTCASRAAAAELHLHSFLRLCNHPCLFPRTWRTYPCCALSLLAPPFAGLQATVAAARVHRREPWPALPPPPNRKPNQGEPPSSPPHLPRPRAPPARRIPTGRAALIPMGYIARSQLFPSLFLEVGA
jgi:hypothetical protein